MEHVKGSLLDLCRLGTINAEKEKSTATTSAHRSTDDSVLSGDNSVGEYRPVTTLKHIFFCMGDCEGQPVCLQEKHLYSCHGDAEVQQHKKLPSMTYSDSV